jgi:hypothetical protein
MFAYLAATAVATALLTLFLAVLLLARSPEDRAAQRAAYDEVLAHRQATRCFFARIVESQRLLAEYVGAPVESIPTISTNGFDCDHIPAVPAASAPPAP